MEYGEILGLGFTRGVDAAELHVIGGEGQASTLGLAQEPDFESRVSGLLEHDLAVGGRAAGETDAAQAEQAVARFEVARRNHLPARAVDAHAGVLIPRPGLGRQNETVARVAEARLQERANVAGDEVGGGGRVAVVDDAGDGARLAIPGAAERGVKTVEHALGIVQQRFGCQRSGCRGPGVRQDREDANGGDCGRGVHVARHRAERCQLRGEFEQGAQLRLVRRVDRGKQRAQGHDAQRGMEREVAHGQNLEYTKAALPPALQ